MERIQEEMVKMSQDERDRYLYLREAMAASDRVSQLQSAENRGRREGKEEGRKEGIYQGKILTQISMIQKKVKKNKNLEQIVDELEEPMEEIKPIYDQVKQHPDKTAEEIYNLINNEEKSEDITNEYQNRQSSTKPPERLQLCPGSCLCIC